MDDQMVMQAHVDGNRTEIVGEPDRDRIFGSEMKGSDQR
jgi:hypothetical protein